MLPAHVVTLQPENPVTCSYSAATCMMPCMGPAGKLAVTAAALNGSLLPRGDKERSTTDDTPISKSQVCLLLLQLLTA